jgi:hypothetical protein
MGILTAFDGRLLQTARIAADEENFVLQPALVQWEWANQIRDLAPLSRGAGRAEIIA